MASKKFLNPINLLNLAEDPASASEGDVYFNTTSDTVKVYANGAWVGVGANPTQEDIQDFVAPLFTHANHINASVTYEDASNELHIDVISAPSAGYTGTIKHDVRLNGSIAKGQAVYVSSADGTNMIVSKASNASEATSSKTLGILESGGSNNALVKVVTEGLLAGLDTSTAGTEGDPVWLGTDGNLIYGLTNKPVAPAHLVFIGIVTRKNSNNGEIFVKVQNGFELSELHTVLLEANGSVADNELLAYDLSSGLWKNQTAAEAGLQTVVSGVSDTEIGYLDGVTSAIQTQIDSKSSTSHNHTINSLSNVVITGTPTDGQALVWDTTTSKWVNETVSAGSSTIDGLTDVTITGTPADNNVLAYDTATSQWINQTAPAAGLLDTSATAQTKAGDLTITGNLTVNGTTTTINSTAINVNNQVIFEGSTADNFETTLTSINPTADRTISLPDESGTLLTTNSINLDVQAFDPGLSSLSGLTGTGFVKKTGDDAYSIDSNTYALSSALASYALINSPSFTGTPLAPTATAGDSSTQIATTAFVSTNFVLKDNAIFTGNVQLPPTTTIGDVTGDEIDHLDGVTSNIQTQLDSKPTITAGVISETVIPDTIARVTDIDNSLDSYIPLIQKGVLDGVATLDSNAKVPAIQLDLTDYAPKANPTFTGTVALPSLTAIGDVSATEISYLDGATSNLQTQISARITTATAEAQFLSIDNAITNYQPKDGDLTAIAALAGTSGFLKKSGTDTWILDDSTYLTTGSAASTYLTINNAINSYATLAAPTFTGIVVLPSTTSIGTVSATEIGYLDGVTSSIQTQLNGKEASHSHPYQTANASLSSIAALAGTAGFIKFDGTSTYSVDTNTYLVRNQPTVDTAIIAGTTTFNIANSIATTLNIGGAATAITIGSTNANAETIIRTPKINSNASSIQLFNTTSTTIEFAGAATTLHIGGTSTAGSTFNIGANATASGNQKTLNIATGAASGSSTVINVGTVNDGITNLYGDVVAHGTIEVPIPLTNAQAANKGYVDALAAGINIKPQVKYATTSALSVTYTAGTSDTSGGFGENAYMTATTNGAFSPDGTEVVATERVLVKNQADAKQNGIYVVTDPGDGDSPFILTRTADFNGESATNGIVKNGDYVFITAGSVNSNASFVLSQPGSSTTPTGAIKFGTDNVLFSQYSGVPGNITTLGVVTQGVWQSTRIQKEYLDDELATLANPTFTGNVVVPTPVVDTNAATKKYVDDSILANAAALPDIIPIDDIRGQFNGIDSRFQPKFQGQTLSILNPLRLLLSVNGIIQTVDFPEYVWQSFLPREGFMVDNDGYIAFSEVPPAGSTFDARLMPGPNINSVKKGYPFKAVDILLGA
ncbi:hypothetical protein UFOVP359_113 [uncultured Caudovirales phage]|uniref:Uncharacterized protein n=1 Tax=uncultured Caudovirales phage TaxID=2100421 RepID=A0A6J7WV84_9CAUD|nr:hypothetical protein UFOVP359_113 [uncultured Caudovirales phage]